jgi:hypothetical protein
VLKNQIIRGPGGAAADKKGAEEAKNGEAQTDIKGVTRFQHPRA